MKTIDNFYSENIEEFPGFSDSVFFVKKYRDLNKLLAHPYGGNVQIDPHKTSSSSVRFSLSSSSPALYLFCRLAKMRHPHDRYLKRAPV